MSMQIAARPVSPLPEAGVHDALREPVGRAVMWTSAITALGTFLLMGFLSLVAVAYFWRNVPETEGPSLEEIETEMA
jgi:hypothetical protein